MKLVSAHNGVPVIFIFALLALTPTQAFSHCTLYHPNHCTNDIIEGGRRIDPTNPNSDVREGGRRIDPTNPNSGVREGGRRIDPTNPNSGVRNVGRDIDRQRIDLYHLGGQGCRAKAFDVIRNNSGPSRGLTSFEKKYLTPWFGNEIDLDQVTVVWDANLNNAMKIGGQTVWVESSAQTFGYRLFFRTSDDPGKTVLLIDLAHELVHTVQHERLGGLTRFCQKYMDGYVNGGMDYFGNPMEEEAFNLEFRFAQSLQNQPSATGDIVRINHGMPNNLRTVWVPERLNISPQTRNSSTARDTYYEFTIHNATGNLVRYSINGESYSLRDRYSRDHKLKRCHATLYGGESCNKKPRISFDSSFEQGRQEKSYTAGDYPRETFRRSGYGLDLYH